MFHVQISWQYFGTFGRKNSVNLQTSTFILHLFRKVFYLAKSWKYTPPLYSVVFLITMRERGFVPWTSLWRHTIVWRDFFWACTGSAYSRQTGLTCWAWLMMNFWGLSWVVTRAWPPFVALGSCTVPLGIPWKVILYKKYTLLLILHFHSKGQLISKCLFEKIVWTKIPTKHLIDPAQQVHNSGQNLSNFSLVFWSKRFFQKDI